MAAKALLDHTPSPTPKDVQHGLSGNFCRCGTYAGMRLAVLAAAGHMDDDDIPLGSGDAAGAKEGAKDAAPKGKGGKAHG
jgi:aerobic carbon-monoxide dehydrogenase small subunit